MEVSKIKSKNEVNENIAEILGLLCSEGNYRDYYSNYYEFDKRRNKTYLRKNQRTRILEFSNKNVTLITRFLDMLALEFNYTPNITLSNGDVKRVCITKHRVMDKLLRFTKFGCDKWQVPIEILCGSSLIKKSFIRGFFFGDGCIDKTWNGKDRYRITSINRSGIKGISEMLTSLEIKHSLLGPYYRINQRPYFEILVRQKSNQRFLNEILAT